MVTGGETLGAGVCVLVGRRVGGELAVIVMVELFVVVLAEVAGVVSISSSAKGGPEMTEYAEEGRISLLGIVELDHRSDPNADDGARSRESLPVVDDSKQPN